jgi:hypothetical protein
MGTTTPRLKAWAKDMSLPDDHIITESMKFINMMILERFRRQRHLHVALSAARQGLLRIERTLRMLNFGLNERR